jgi:hypothetical protein
VNIGKNQDFHAILDFKTARAKPATGPLLR